MRHRPARPCDGGPADEPTTPESPSASDTLVDLAQELLSVYVA